MIKSDKNHTFPQNDLVEITIDIDEGVLETAMRMTGETKKGPAVVKFIRREMPHDFAHRIVRCELGIIR